MLSVPMLSVIIPSVVMLSVAILSVVMLSDMTPKRFLTASAWSNEAGRHVVEGHYLRLNKIWMKTPTLIDDVLLKAISLTAL
jgi:hypothetical protein